LGTQRHAMRVCLLMTGPTRRSAAESNANL
jgi:hypothetical protein